MPVSLKKVWLLSVSVKVWLLHVSPSERGVACVPLIEGVCLILNDVLHSSTAAHAQFSLHITSIRSEFSLVVLLYLAHLFISRLQSWFFTSVQTLGCVKIRSLNEICSVSYPQSLTESRLLISLKYFFCCVVQISLSHTHILIIHICQKERQCPDLHLKVKAWRLDCLWAAKHTLIILEDMWRTECAFIH